jgi:hypothetical protein
LIAGEQKRRTGKLYNQIRIESWLEAAWKKP